MNDAPPSSVMNALTVDVEDYFHATAFKAFAAPANYPSRVEGNTRRVLELLYTLDLRGTFFVLGRVAERFPYLIREIRAAGHDLGCHSYDHALVYELTPTQFREDTRRARNAIENAAGCGVNAYRAPTFSITRQSLWALEILLELGFTIDSSIFPTRNHLYGIANAPRRPFRILIQGAELLEFPLPVYDLAGLGLPFTGGTYLRLLPLGLQMAALKRLANRNQPVVMYFHPWELDPEQPRLANAFGPKFYHYAALGRTESRLRKLLTTFRFGTLQDLDAAAAPVYTVASTDSKKRFLAPYGDQNDRPLHLAAPRVRRDG